MNQKQYNLSKAINEKDRSFLNQPIKVETFCASRVFIQGECSVIYMPSYVLNLVIFCRILLKRWIFTNPLELHLS